MLTAGGWALYLGLLNQGMSDHLVSEVRTWYASTGMTPEQVDQIAAEAREAFGLKAYIVKGGVGAFVLGILFSVVLMGWHQWRSRR